MNILRNIILFGWMAIACTAFAQDRNADKVERPNTKKINFGIKAGFNSSMFMVSELKIKDVTIDEVQNNYKIGYFGAIFMRFNIKKHFIQPEASTTYHFLSILSGLAIKLFMDFPPVIQSLNYNYLYNEKYLSGALVRYFRTTSYSLIIVYCSVCVNHFFVIFPGFFSFL